MKKRNLLSGFAVAALLALGITGTAHANTYLSCANFNNNNPTAPSGDVVVNNTGACSLNAVNISTGSFTVDSSGTVTASSVQASTSVTLKSSGGGVTATNITATNGAVYLSAGASTGDVTATTITGTGGTIQVLAPGGSITINGTVTGTNTTQVFKAKTNVGLKGDVTNNGTGDIRIFASSNGGSTPFAIGSSTSNGVTSIKNNGSNGGNIYISNGSSTGGITYAGDAAPGKLQSQGSSGPAGIIILDGGSNNKITLSGDLNANGSTGQRSGGVLLFATEIITNNATISANAPNQQVGSIALTTNKITNNSGLVLNINGDGQFNGYVDLSITPVGSWTVTASPTPSTPITFGPFTSSTNPLTITGASGDFTINANGNNNGLKIWGPSLTITTKSTKITQQGGGNGIYLSAWDGASTTSNLTLTGDVQIKENTTGANQAANLIQIDPASITALTHNVLLDASGTGGGDGSNINLYVTSGALSLGDSSTDFQLKADGSSTGGKGGIVNVFGGQAAFTIKSGTAVTASAQGGNGDAGYIDIESLTISNGSGASSINANAKGTGNGDISYPNVKIIAGSSGTLSLGTGAGKLQLSANGSDGTGNGGSIELANFTAVTLSSDISVSAGTGGGNGQGGTISIHDFGNFQVVAGAAPKLTADGHGTGKAGMITILALNSNTIVLDNATLSASGDPSSSGSGNAISVTDQGAISVANTTINANGGGTGGDAGSVLLGVYDSGAAPIDLSTAHLNAKASVGGGGQGGQVTVTLATTPAGATYLNVNSIIKVDGDGAGATAFGGFISINNVQCQQYPVGAGGATKPKFWGCLNPQTATSVPAAINAIPAALLANIQGLSTYVFASIDDYNSFFKTSGGDLVTGGLGVTTPVGKTNTSSVFVSTGSGVDYTPYLNGNMMHEIGHLLDQNMAVTPSGTAAFQTAATNTINALKGTWPNPKNPTCQQVFGNTSPLCVPAPNISPWQQFLNIFIATQNPNKELFADGFQNCSNTDLYSVSENNALRSSYMKGTALNPALWIYMNTTFWPGGCPRVE